MGRFNGRDAIIEGLGAIAKSDIPWSFHVPGGPLIQLVGHLDPGQSVLVGLVPSSSSEQGRLHSRLVWGAIQYNGDLVEQQGYWKFSRLLLEVRLRTPFEGPWTEVH